MRSFDKFAFNCYFDDLYNIIGKRIDPEGPYEIRNDGSRGEFRGLFSHTFNQYRSKAQDAAEMYVRHGHLIWLYNYTWTMSEFGERRFLGKFLTAPREDWEIINHTIGLRTVPYSVGLCGPPGDKEYRYDELKKIMQEDIGV